MEFTNEELHYFRVCNIVTRIIPDGLRKIFKQQWDALYTGTHGQWFDTPSNYMSFYAMEFKMNRKRNQRNLGNMTNGDRKEWDCTCLFYAIMYSDSVGPMLPTIVKNSVDDLREIRNDFAHNNVGTLPEADFQASIQKILTAFTALKLNTTRIEELKTQTNFPTQESNSLKQELEEEKKRNAEPSSFCVLPPKPCHNTIDRMHEVERICEMMKQLSSEKKGETTVVYLTGNPGCGKSVLARQIGEKYFVSDETANLNFIMTLNASTLDTLLQSYVEFAQRLKCYPDSITSITTSKDLSQENQLLQLKALTVRQIDKYSSWLIIIDNVTDLKSFSRYWPHSGEKTSCMGQILVTTQDSRSIAPSPHSRHICLINGMSDGEAMEVLCKVSARTEDNKMMLKVSKALDMQPLALACAGVYMHRVRITNTLFTWEEYLEKLEKGKLAATERVYEETNQSYPLTMTVAVRLALQREITENEIMLHAFDFLSVMTHEPIPLEYVVQYVMKCLPHEDEDLVASTVSSSSLVISFGDAKEISVHQVVYNCLATNEERRQEVDMFVVISAFTSLLESFDKNNIKDITKSRPLANHFADIAKYLTSYIVQHQNACGQIYLNDNFDSLIHFLSTIGNICVIHGNFQTAEVYYQVCLSMQLQPIKKQLEKPGATMDGSSFVYLNNLGNTLHQLGKYEHAIACYEKSALEIERTAYGETHPSMAATLYNLGNTLHELKQYEQAKACYEKSIEIKKTAYGENHPSMAATLNNLGEILHEQGQYEQAKACYEKSIEIKKTAYGANHPSMAATLYNLGIALHELEQYEKAIACYEKALEIRKTAYGENHPSMAATLNNLGNTLHELKQYEQAKACYEKSLQIKRTAYGENHPSMAATLNNLGDFLYELEQYEQAKACYEKALEIRKTAYGENHPSMAATLNNLDELGQYEQAKECYEKSLEIQKTAYGENHASITDTLNNLGITLDELGEYEQAKACYEKSLEIQKTAYGENHPSITDTLNNLGNTLHELGQYEQAKECFEKSLEIQKTAYGENHASITDTLNNLGITLHELGQYEQAKACYEKSLEIQKTAYGENHPSITDTLNNLGNTLHELGQYEQAKECFEKSLEIQKTAYGENHASITDTLNNLGITLHELGQYEQAKECFEKSLELQKTAYGENHASTADTLYNLGNTLDELKQYQQAKACYEKSLEIKKTAYGENHASTADTLNNLGNTLDELKQYQQAKACYKKSLEIQKTAYGENHASTADTLNNLGNTLRRLGQYEQAKACYEKALEIEMTVYGEKPLSSTANGDMTLTLTPYYILYTQHSSH
ncbi:hypothetical protein QZH41_008033 [Actinostola sp. cb2023]|nr:hypothetical protein QZH41_008033 [Actinostola sp. cb2023]